MQRALRACAVLSPVEGPFELPQGERTCGEGELTAKRGRRQIGRLESGGARFWIPAYAGMTKGRPVIAAEAAIQEALLCNAPCLLGLSGPVLSRVEGPFELPQGERTCWEGELTAKRGRRK